MPDVLVTGASRGVGLAIAQALAAEGYRVIAIARGPSPPLERTIDAAAAEGVGEIVFEAFDLARLDEIAGFVRTLKKRYGPLHGLVNNAAISGDGLLANMPNAAIESLIRLNTVSPIILTKYVVRAMMARGAGRIINIASIIASTGYSGLSVYGATKASMIGFTKSLAREAGPRGVTVNAIAPGFLDTEMTRSLGEEGRLKIVGRSALRRLAGVDDVAAAVAYLLGDGGKSVTGTVLTIDAGATA